MEEHRLPIKLDTTSNGEFVPVPLLRAKIFGQNAARVYGIEPQEVQRYLSRDALARERAAYLERPAPHFRTYGPKTRREFLALRARGGT